MIEFYLFRAGRELTTNAGGSAPHALPANVETLAEAREFAAALLVAHTPRPDEVRWIWMPDEWRARRVGRQVVYAHAPAA